MSGDHEDEWNLSCNARLVLQRELAELNKHAIQGFSIGLNNENIFKWEISVIGPMENHKENDHFISVFTFSFRRY